MSLGLCKQTIFDKFICFIDEYWYAVLIFFYWYSKQCVCKTGCGTSGEGRSTRGDVGGARRGVGDAGYGMTQHKICSRGTDPFTTDTADANPCSTNIPSSSIERCCSCGKSKGRKVKQASDPSAHELRGRSQKCRNGHRRLPIRCGGRQTGKRLSCGRDIDDGCSSLEAQPANEWDEDVDAKPCGNLVTLLNNFGKYLGCPKTCGQSYDESGPDECAQCGGNAPEFLSNRSEGFESMESCQNGEHLCGLDRPVGNANGRSASAKTRGNTRSRCSSGNRGAGGRCRNHGKAKRCRVCGKPYSADTSLCTGCRR